MTSHKYYEDSVIFSHVACMEVG